MRLARTRVFGLYRDIYRAIGEELFAVGRLDEPRDVFYLAVDEIAAYHGGTTVSADSAAIARARKTEYAKYEAEELPITSRPWGRYTTGTLLGSGHRARRCRGRQRARPRGLGCSPGVVEAEIRVINSPQDDSPSTAGIPYGVAHRPWLGAPVPDGHRHPRRAREYTVPLGGARARARDPGGRRRAGSAAPHTRRGARTLDGSAGTVERLSKAPSDA